MITLGPLFPRCSAAWALLPWNFLSFLLCHLEHSRRLSSRVPPTAPKQSVEWRIHQPLYSRIKSEDTENSVTDQNVVREKLQDGQHQPRWIREETEQRHDPGEIPRIAVGPERQYCADEQVRGACWLSLLPRQPECQSPAGGHADKCRNFCLPTGHPVDHGVQAGMVVFPGGLVVDKIAAKHPQRIPVWNQHGNRRDPR